MTQRSQVQQEYGTAAQIAAYTGVAREIIVNTDDNSLHVTDGITPGGTKMATQGYVQSQIATLAAGLSSVLTLGRRCG